jgi:hypothetical protein
MRKHHLSRGYSELNIFSEPRIPQKRLAAYSGAPSLAQVNLLGWIGLHKSSTLCKMKFCTATATKQVMMIVPIWPLKTARGFIFV